MRTGVIFGQLLGRSLVVLLGLLLSGCTSGEKDQDGPILPDLSGIRAETPEVPKTGTYRVRFKVPSGEFVVEVNREWAPIGAERFHQLVSAKYFDGCGFFRVVPGFMVQFGLNGDPATTRRWDMNLPDDPVKESNTRGMITFATAGPNTRTTQVFINFGDNQRLDSEGFAPFGRVVEGMEAVDAIYAGHKEKPDQSLIEAQGNEYLKSAFPGLDFIESARLEE